MKMYVSLYQEYNIKNQRMICACLLAYAGFLRSEELLRLRPTDIRFNSVYMNVFIEFNLERYFARAKINEDSELYTFYRLTSTNKG